MSKLIDQGGIEHYTQLLVDSTKTINGKSIWGTGDIDIKSIKIIPINGTPWENQNNDIQNSITNWFNQPNEFGGDYATNYEAFKNMYSSLGIIFICNYTNTSGTNAIYYIYPYSITNMGSTGQNSAFQLKCKIGGNKYEGSTTSGTPYLGDCTIGLVSTTPTYIYLTSYKFEEIIDSSEPEYVNVTYDISSGSGLSSSSITLSKEETHINFDCNFNNTCPASAVTYQLKIPKTNYLDHYRVFITAKAGGTYGFGDCTTIGKFIDILGDRYTTGSDTWGVLFNLQQSRMSGSGYKGLTNALSSYYRFSWGELTNNYAQIIIDFYKHHAGYPNNFNPTSNIFYIGEMRVYNSDTRMNNTYLYPTA